MRTLARRNDSQSVGVFCGNLAGPATFARRKAARVTREGRSEAANSLPQGARRLGTTPEREANWGSHKTRFLAARFPTLSLVGGKKAATQAAATHKPTDPSGICTSNPTILPYKP